jgi:hypothetical protein
LYQTPPRVKRGIGADIPGECEQKAFMDKILKRERAAKCFPDRPIQPSLSPAIMLSCRLKESDARP